MDTRTVEVITRDKDPEGLFGRLEIQGIKKFNKLCEGAIDFQLEPEQVGWLSYDTTHILRLVVKNVDGKRRTVTFAYLNVNPSPPIGKPPVSYAELVLLCGRYKFTHGSTTWKGSEVLVDKAMELAKVAGKTTLRLEALNKDLYEKVYKPMGFEPVVGDPISTQLQYERKIGGRLRLNVQRRRTQRNGRGRKHRQLRKFATRRR
jgi:hypothetical protein